MDKIKKYWMPAIAALFVIAGLSDFSLVTILLGAGIGYVWWKDVRESSAVDKKSVTFKIARWLLAGIGCDMLFHGNIVGGIVLLAFVFLWAKGVFSNLKITQSKVGRTCAVKSKAKKTVAQEMDSVSDEWRQKIRNKAVRRECARLMRNAYDAVVKDGPTALRDMLGYSIYYDHEIRKIDLFSFKSACARMTTEERKLQKVACKIDPSKKSVVNAAPVDIWSVPSGEQSGAYSYQECDTCQGHKHVICPSCHGEHTHWDCPDCHGEAGVLHGCPECDGDGEVECPDCHGELEVSCPTCHGTGLADCPKCDGTGHLRCDMCSGKGYYETFRKTTCHVCNGTGNVQRNENTYTCDNCRGDGYEMERYNEPCRTCGGKGYEDCYKCNASGHIKCEACQSSGKVHCKTCHHTGTITCDTCDGDGKLKCSKCNSTGTEYCHTCGGDGTVVCPNCHGEGGFASVQKVSSTVLCHEKIEAWSECGLPKSLIPKLFPEASAVNGCTVIYSARSDSPAPDDAMVLSEEALKIPVLKKLFDGAAAMVQVRENVRLIQQSVELLEIHDIARVEIHSTYKTQHANDFAGKDFVCWLNLSTGELLDIGLLSNRPDSWYETHDLSESEGSPYGYLEQARQGKMSWWLLHRLGNPIAMAEYGRALYEGKAEDKKTDKKLGCLLQQLAEYVGVVDTPYTSAFSWSDMRYGDHNHWLNTQSSLWSEVLPRFIKLVKHADKDCVSEIFRPLGACGKDASPYRLQDLPLEYVQDLFSYSSSQSEDRDVGFSAYVDGGRLSNEQRVAVLRKCPRAYQIMTNGAAFTPTEFGAALWGSDIDELIEQYGFDKASKAYTINDWYDFFMTFDSSGAEKFTKRVDWKQLEQLPIEKWAKLFACSARNKIEEAIDWKWMFGNHLEEMIILSNDVSLVDNVMDWKKLEPQLKSFDWHKLTDDQRVEFAIGHEDQASIVLKCGFDPNKLRPWCLDLSYDKWPERMSAFDPDRYDWAQCSPRMWAQIAYGHPEFVKYCPVDGIDWHALDDEKIKYWKWALGAFGEKIVSQFTKWGELDEERWNDILKKQPALAEYKKKYGKKS